MAVQVKHFSIAVPAGTLEASPLTFQMQLGEWEVKWIEVDVPDMGRNPVGFFIASSGVQQIPFTANQPQFLVLNNVSKHWDLTGQPTSGDWQLVAFNQGNYAHTLVVGFGLDLTSSPGPYSGMNNIIPAARISS